MNNKITYQQVIDRLGENALSHGVMTLQNDISIVISQRGGRIFGPFLSPVGESVFWANPAFAQQDTFKALLCTGDWNLGGDCTYLLNQSGADEWFHTQNLVDTDNGAAGCKKTFCETQIRPVEDPLQRLNCYPDLIGGVTYAGYEQMILCSQEKHNNPSAGNLIQLNPGGWLLIPAIAGVECTQYLQPVHGSLRAIYSNHLRFKITGTRQYEVGLKAEHLFGRIGYLNFLDDGRAYLIVRYFSRNPATSIVEEPGYSPDSVHIYNDGGHFGGFGGLEVRPFSADQLQFWLYVGPVDKIKRIGLKLLGIEI